MLEFHRNERTSCSVSANMTPHISYSKGRITARGARREILDDESIIENERSRAVKVRDHDYDAANANLREAN